MEYAAVLEMFLRHVKSDPKRLVLNQCTYFDLFKGAVSCMNVLRDNGVLPGDRICIYAVNSPESIMALFGIWFAGCIAIFVQDDLWIDEIISDSRSALVITDTEIHKPIKSLLLECVVQCDLPEVKLSLFDIHNIKNSDIALLIYTSGSTSKPKGVIERFENIDFVVSAIIKSLGICSSDRILIKLPFGFDYGLYQIFYAIYTNAFAYNSVDIRNIFFTTKEIKENCITIFPVTPAILRAWLSVIGKNLNEIECLRMITSTGEYISDNLILETMKVFPEVCFVPMYGLTECKRVSIMPSDAPLNKRLKSVGKCIPGTSCVVVNDVMEKTDGVGELIVFGPHIMSGYWNDPKETAERFILFDNKLALRTGDIMHQDREGYLYFHYRRSGLLKQNAHRISSTRIEQCVMKIEGVRDACAVNYIDPTGLEKICCYYVGDIPADKMKFLCYSYLKTYEIPYIFKLINCIPTTFNGKNDRRLLSNLACKMNGMDDNN